ncbi:MAG: hypothetical protein RL142_954 [Actinomycetota bacterium]
MTNTRGMSVSQAKSLARDPKTSPGVLSRLANGYPEVWDDLLENPATFEELRAWILNAKFEQANPKVLAQPQPVVQKDPEVKYKRIKTRGRRKYGRSLRTVASLLLPILAIYGLMNLVDYLDHTRPVKAVVANEDLPGVSATSPWTYDLEVTGKAGCATFETATMDQNQAIVLIQNDLENKDCKNADDPVPSTLALVDLATGKSIWKVDLAAELDWTEKWSKHLVEIPGLNEIIVKFIDVNGGDVGGDSKSIDENDNKKMKTLVPYNRLNGTITDPVIAKSKAQPIIQSPVLEVFAIPGNLRSVLVMTGGAKKDFRYAKYRSKRFSSPRWSVESDLKPMGGIPVVGTRLVLGREKDDQPQAVNIGSGKFEDWHGQAAVKLYRIGKHTIEIKGDGVSDKATNLESQGGLKGHDITVTGISGYGDPKWTLEAKGYAISRDDTRTTAMNRSWYSKLFLLSGKHNRIVSLVDVSQGTLAWTTKMSKTRFEISRVSASNSVSVYLFDDRKLVAKNLSILNLADGLEQKIGKISGASVRVDGATTPISVLVDEPSRKRLIEDAEDGKTPSINNAKDESNKIRTCASGIDNLAYKINWTLDCNGNHHVIRVAGKWLLLDLSAGSESFKLIRGDNNG